MNIWISEIDRKKTFGRIVGEGYIQLAHERGNPNG